MSRSPCPPAVEPTERLRGKIGRLQLFALGFGSIVGSSWVIILNQWLAFGPGAALLGFAVGGLVMVAVGACYAELTARVPAAGAEFVFALTAYGRRTAFYVGWFVALSWVCITVFEGLAVVWFIQHLFPQLNDVTLYHAFGASITRNQLLAGGGGALIIGRINYAGGDAAARFQGVLTYGFVALSLAIMADMLLHARAANFVPFVQNHANAPWWYGTASVFATCAFVLNGFQSVSQAVEERSSSVPLASVARIMVATVAAGAAFYSLTVVAASAAAPWPVLAKADLSIIKAAESLPGGRVIGAALLLAGLASLLKTWNAIFMTSARSLLALARYDLLPRWLAHIDPKTGAPARAVIVVGLLNLLGLFLGRGAVSSLVDTSATSVVICFVICCIAVPLMRRRETVAPSFRVPGGPWIITAAIVGASLMAIAGLVTPLLRGEKLPLEYLLLAGWGVAGLVLWRAFGRKHPLLDATPPVQLNGQLQAKE